MKRILFVLIVFSKIGFISADDIVLCPQCGGRGHIIGVYTAAICPRCYGNGKIVVPSSNRPRTVNGYIWNGREYSRWCNVTYFSNGVAVISNYENQPLKMYNSSVKGFDYFVILTLPNYQTVTIYFRQ